MKRSPDGFIFARNRVKKHRPRKRLIIPTKTGRTGTPTMRSAAVFDFQRVEREESSIRER